MLHAVSLPGTTPSLKAPEALEGTIMEPSNGLSVPTWDNEYVRILRELEAQGSDVETTTRGRTRELLSYQFHLANPRDRVVFNPVREFNIFQTIGLWLCMTAGRSDYGFLNYYHPWTTQFSADLRQVEGAYGPRLFGAGANRQIPRCIETLRTRPASRQVIAMVYDAVLDAHRHKQENRVGEVPCTISLQFFLRDDRLHCVTNMRSQEAVFLLPQDVFHFTLFQEFIAASLGVEMGTYHHHCGSIHNYEKRRISPATVIDAPPGFRAPMPAMEPGDQMPHLLRVLTLEERIRINALDFVAQKARRSLDSAHHFREARDLPAFWRSVVHACIGQAAYYTGEKDVLREYTPKVDAWLHPFFRKACELKGGEKLLDNYGLIPGYEPTQSQPST